jgi:hypothetical protein
VDGEPGDEQPIGPALMQSVDDTRRRKKKCHKRIPVMKISDSPLIVPYIISAEIDYKGSGTKRKQKPWPFNEGQMKKELDSSDPDKSKAWLSVRLVLRRHRRNCAEI